MFFFSNDGVLFTGLILITNCVIDNLLSIYSGNSVTISGNNCVGQGLCPNNTYYIQHLSTMLCQVPTPPETTQAYEGEDLTPCMTIPKPPTPPQTLYPTPSECQIEISSKNSFLFVSNVFNFLFLFLNFE